MKAFRGFTLIELLVVLMLAVIVVAMGVPAFQGVVANQRIISSTNEFISSLILARSEAIQRATFVSMCKSANGLGCGGVGVAWNDGWIVFANAAGSDPSTVAAGDQLIRVYSGLRDGMTVNSLGAITDFATFRPTGTAGTAVQNHSGTLTLCDDRGAANARGVIVTTSGRASVSYDIAHDATALVCP